MAALLVGAVVSGTWMVYAGYRAKPPAGTTDVLAYPQVALESSPGTEGWHDFAWSGRSTSAGSHASSPPP